MSKKTIPQDPLVSSRSLGGFGGFVARRCAEPEPCESAQPPGDPEGTAAEAIEELELDPGRFITFTTGVPAAMLIDLCRRGEEAQVRALLVELCRGGRVRQDDWTNRDSSDNQRQLAECGALLEAGCRFDVDLDLSSIECYSIDVFFRGWDWPDDHEEAAEGFIIPTAERLAELGGKDWSP